MAINLNDNIKVLAGKATDARYLNNLTPYATTTEANTIVTSALRYRGLTVNIAGVEYWYKDGILDGNLVVKDSAISGVGITGATNGLTKSGSNVKLGGALTEATTLSGAQTLNLGCGLSTSRISDLNVSTSGAINIQSCDVMDINAFNDMGISTFNGGTLSIGNEDYILSLSGSGAEFTDNGNGEGICYAAPYNFTARSLVDAAYVTGKTSTSGIQTASNGLTKSGSNVKLGGNLTENTYISGSSGTRSLGLGTVGSRLGGLNSYSCGGVFFWENNGGGFTVREEGGGGITFCEAGGGGMLFKEFNGGGIYLDDADGGGIFLDSYNTGGIYLTDHNSGGVDIESNGVTGTLNLQASTSSINIAPLGMTVTDGTNSKGLVYAANYNANFTAQSLVDKYYVDSIATGLNPHAAVIAATIAPITLSGLSTVDSITLTNGMRVLVKNQGDGTQNGIYNASTTTWQRSADANFNPTGEVGNGDLVPVLSGSTNAATQWILVTANPIISGVTSLEYTLFSKQLGIVAGTGINVTPSGSNQEISAKVCNIAAVGTEIPVKINPAGTNRMYVDASDINLSASITGATNGLTKSGQKIKLGGALTNVTTISGGFQYSVDTTSNIYFGTTQSNMGNVLCLNDQGFRACAIHISGEGTQLQMLQYGANLCYSTTNVNNNINIGSNNVCLTNQASPTNTTYLNMCDGYCMMIGSNSTNFCGAMYAANYASKFVARSLVDAAYVTGKTAQAISASTIGWSNLANENTVVGCGTPIASGYAGFGNTIYGVQALTGGTGGYNVAIGSGTIQNNVSGEANIGIGYQALVNNTVGYCNIALGKYALYSNIGAAMNVAIGVASLYANTYGENNIAIGDSALLSNTEGFNNIGIGNFTLGNNSTGIDNIAIGYNSLCSNTTGSNNIANGSFSLITNSTGSNNIANGYQALAKNTTGSENIANGYQALSANTTGINNIASGFKALGKNTTGSNNIANGYNTLYSNTEGSGNVANGCQALYSNTTGYQNIAVGCDALYSNTTGNNNIANGTEALFSNIEGNSNIAIGVSVLHSNTTGCNNIAIGDSSLYSNTTGCFNVANGAVALYDNTTGSNNIANGFEALCSNQTGSNNIANGYRALAKNTVSNNIALGYQALSANTTGTNNIANGYQTLVKNTTGGWNIGIGGETLFSNLDGNQNVGIGYQVLYSNTSGGNNIANGWQALYSNTTGNYNIASGFKSLCSNIGGSNNVGLGNQALRGNTTGNYNISIGDCSQYSRTNGNNNITFGTNSLRNNDGGLNNVVIGGNGLYTNTIGCCNTVIGNAGGYNNVTGSSSVFIGNHAGYEETTSGKLHIANTSSCSLIYGDFAQNYVTLPTLKLCTTPSAGLTSDSVLVWNSTDKTVKTVGGTSLGDRNNIYSYTTVTTSVTLTTGSSYVILANSPTSGITLTLPATPLNGQAFKLKDIGGNALVYGVTVAGNGKNIDGAATALINTSYGALEIMYNGSNWFSMAFIN